MRSEQVEYSPIVDKIKLERKLLSLAGQDEYSPVVDKTKLNRELPSLGLGRLSTRPVVDEIKFKENFPHWAR
jgi:hypothetical protein